MMTRKEFLEQYLIDNNLTIEEFRNGFVILKDLDGEYKAIIKGEQSNFIKERRSKGVTIKVEEIIDDGTDEIE